MQNEMNRIGLAASTQFNIWSFSLILFGSAFILANFPAVSFASDGNNAYHLSGAMVCSDCHFLYGAPRASIDDGNTAMLKTSNITDLCLGCHVEGHNTAQTSSLYEIAPGNWEAPIVMTQEGSSASELGIAMPAGDFYWANIDPGKGHNPALTGGRSAMQLKSDNDLKSSPPGGHLISGNWSCISCHGSHGKFSDDISAWRQLKRKINGHVVTGDVSLYGVELTAGSLQQNPSYEPIKSNSRGIYSGNIYVSSRGNRSELEGANLFKPEGDRNKNIYRGGFSSFCSACHGSFHEGNGSSSANFRTSSSGSWLKHPTNFKMGESIRYGINAYAAEILTSQGINPNPEGYDWKYPLIKADNDYSISVQQPAANNRNTLSDEDRLTCLTCHKAHASQYDNMTRWDARSHSFIASGEEDFTGQVAATDNLAYGCGKCHQMGGQIAFVKRF